MARRFAKTTFAALAPAILAIAACQSANISVLSSSPIAAGATYAWNPVRPPRELTRARRVDNDRVREGITTAVDANLATRGFQRVEPAQAQYLLAYDVRVLNSQANDSWLVRDIDHVETRMMLDITDRSTGQVVWRATSQQRVYMYDEEEEGLDAIFADMANTLPGASSAAGPAPPR